MNFTYDIKNTDTIVSNVMNHYLTNNDSSKIKTDLVGLVATLWCKDKHPFAGLSFDKVKKLLTSNKKHVTISSSGNKRVVMYKDGCEWDMCTANARGATYDNDTKTFSFCLPKFFSDKQLGIKLLDDESYTVFPKYDGSAIYIKNNNISTLGSFKSNQSANLRKFIGDDIINKFPKDYVIFGEFVDPVNDAKVERCTSAIFAITFAYDEQGNKVFPDSLKNCLHSDIVNCDKIEFANSVKMSGKEIYQMITSGDNDVILSNNISLMKEGYVVWDKFGIPFKIKSPLYLKLSDVPRARNFKMNDNNFDSQCDKYLKSVTSIIGANCIYHACIINMMKQEFDNHVSSLKVKAVDKMNIFIDKWNSVVDSLQDVNITNESSFVDIRKYFNRKIKGVSIGKIIGGYGKILKKTPISKITWEMFL